MKNPSWILKFDIKLPHEKLSFSKKIATIFHFGSDFLSFNSNFQAAFRFTFEKVMSVILHYTQLFYLCVDSRYCPGSANVVGDFATLAICGLILSNTVVFSVLFVCRITNSRED